MTTFSELTGLYTEIENVMSHKKIVELLSSFFSKLKPSEAKIASYLALGNIGPKYEETELNLGEKLGLRAIIDAYGTTESKVNNLFANLGDLGNVAFELNKNKKSYLEMKDVFNQFVKIRDASGKGSQKKKVSLLSELLSKASATESRYIMRIALGELRLGFGEQFLIEAFALAFTDSKNNVRKIEDTYNVCTDIGQLAESLSKHGINSMDKFSIKLGRPVQSMLAKRVDTIAELNEKFPGEMAAEEKYDGERVQIHINQNKIKAFSRRLEDITSQFPDIVDAVSCNIKTQKAVLDGEIIAYKNGEKSSFQELMKRRRVYNVEEYAEKIPVVVYFFDILYLNGKSLLKRPYPERRNLLEKYLNDSNKIKLVKRIVSSNFKDIQEFFEECINKGLEGIIVKSTDKNSIYQPGKRGWMWVKWKKEYSEGMRETFDLVVVGAYHGRGKRKHTFGALLCAVLNKETNQYETFTKVGTGFSDSVFDEIENLLEKHEIDRQPPEVVIEKNIQPDRYIEPAVVIEVLGAEITTSPYHTAGKNNKEKGFALRFPRFLNIRYDKSPEETTTVDEIRELK